MTLIHRKKHDALPTLWLFTDERTSEAALLEAVRRLPKGAGIIFRHGSLCSSTRKMLFDRVRALARKGRKTIILSGTPRQAQAWKADGWHSKASKHLRPPHATAKPMLATRAAHNRREVLAAQTSGAHNVFLSPLFPTRSHPNAQGLGRVKAGLMLKDIQVPVMGLGGMTRHRARTLRILGFAGWGAIDALAGKQPER